MTAESRLFVALLVGLSSFALFAPEVSAQQGVFTGELGGDEFGAAVRGVGDLNGDGFQDFAVGAPGNDGAGSEAGRVYIYFGQAQNLPAQPSLVLSGANAEAFGSAVARIGHFNSDNYDDLAVSAPASNVGGTAIGRVYVFLGGNPMDTTPDLTLSGQQGGDHFGGALDGGFDFNNDGFDDLLAGAPDRPTNGFKSGEARIFYGGSSPSLTAAVILLGDAALDQFGFSVHGAGDFNNDGFDDVIVGAPQPSQLNSGRAYVFFGRNTTNPPARITLTGENGTDRFGWSVAGGGDVNSDTFVDVVVGAPLNDFNLTDNGAAYLFLGGSPANNVFDAKVGGRTGGDLLGSAVSIAGDYNGDGRADLLAGAPGSNAEGEDSGEITLWTGGAPLDTGSRLDFSGPSFGAGFQAGDLFGSSVDFTNYNGDTRSELLAGSPQGNILGGSQTGLASLNFFPGTLVPVTIQDLSIVPAGDRAQLSWRVSEDDGSLIGFHVERRQPGGPWARLTSVLLSADAGGRFQFEDRDPVLSLGGYFDYRLIAVTRDGLTDSFGPFRVAMSPSVRPLLDQNYPNPFAAPATAIPIYLPEPTDATLDIFDAQGRLVRHLFSGRMEAGVTTLTWDGRDDRGDPLPSGSYVSRFESRGTTLTRKLTLAR
jgi:hypothetical protein